MAGSTEGWRPSRRDLASDPPLQDLPDLLFHGDSVPDRAVSEPVVWSRRPVLRMLRLAMGTPPQNRTDFMLAHAGSQACPEQGPHRRLLAGRSILRKASGGSILRTR